MQYNNLGKTGLKVSRICLGCMSFGDASKGWHPWVVNEEAGRGLIRQSLDAGINFFDTANVYAAGSSEEFLGRALRDFTRRDEVVVATKVHGKMREDPNGQGLSRKAIFTEIDASLKRLGMDYVDLYQIHRWDGTTPIEETVEALHDVVKSGKARYIGASTMRAWQFGKALHVSDLRGWTRFVCMQPQYNLAYREEERELLPLCAADGIGVIPWSPLARGRLARPWSERAMTKRGQTDPISVRLYTNAEAADQAVVERLTDVATLHAKPQAQIALAWLLHKPVVSSVIVGATKPQHLSDAIASLDVSLTQEDMHSLEEPYLPHEWIL
ncbi:aldo/keto reductase [uncultured Paludibaculum sp.]|uniref:aldo/keto reductase n=1 Tax=uncultured Paludibaculum sp. TaxID=1765020 RepID=UPI002AAAB144|nr:aldo/keto reductase [uncultured Paludibaculum sp.]